MLIVISLKSLSLNFLSIKAKKQIPAAFSVSRCFSARFIKCKSLVEFPRVSGGVFYIKKNKRNCSSIKAFTRNQALEVMKDSELALVYTTQTKITFLKFQG